MCAGPLVLSQQQRPVQRAVRVNLHLTQKSNVVCENAPPEKTIPKMLKPARTWESRSPGTGPIRQRPSGV
jgi:hypothetical protein